MSPQVSNSGGGDVRGIGALLTPAERFVFSFNFFQNSGGGDVRGIGAELTPAETFVPLLFRNIIFTSEIHLLIS